MAHSSRQALSRKHSDDGAYLCCSAEPPDTKTHSIISITAHKKSQRSLAGSVSLLSLVFHDAFTVNTTGFKCTLWKLNTRRHVCLCLCRQRTFFSPVFAVIENGTEDFEEDDIKTDSFQVRNPLFFRFFSLSL